MKKTVKVLAVMALCLAVPAGLFAQKAGAAKKVVVVYFSTNAADKSAAEAIAKAKNADVKEIVLDKPYDAKATADKAKFFKAEAPNRASAAKLPKIKPVDLASYDTVYVGTEVWNNGASNPVVAFLQTPKAIEGKTVVYYGTTTMESKEADFQKDMDGLVDAKKTGAKAVTKGGIFNAASDGAKITAWLGTIK